MGGAARYQTLRRSERQIRRYNATERTVHIRINPPQPAIPNQPNIPNFMDFLAGAIGDICRDHMGQLDPDDFVRVVINSDSLKHPISTNLLRVRDFDPELILSQAESVVQSNEAVALDGNLSVQFQEIRQPQGGMPSGHDVRHIPDLNTARRIWKCITRIVLSGNLCLPAAICLGKAMSDFGRGDKRYRSLYHSKYQAALRHRAVQLHRRALDREPGRMCRLEDVQQFQDYLPQYRIVVYGWGKRELLFKGPAGAPPSNHIFLVYNRERRHFDFINAPATFLDRSHFCFECVQAYNNPRQHRCAKVCQGCLKPDCPEKHRPLNTLCNDCHRFLAGPACFAQHKVPGPVSNQIPVSGFEIVSQLLASCRREGSGPSFRAAFLW